MRAAPPKTARGVDVAVRVFDAVRVAVSVTPPKSAEDDVGAVLIELLRKETGPVPWPCFCHYTVLDTALLL